MQHGPIDFILVKFGEEHPSANIAAGLKQLIEAETISIIDIIFVEHGAGETVQVLELSDLPDDVYDAWSEIVADMGSLLTADDAVTLATGLGENESAVLVLYENTWARQMSSAIAAANGEVIVHTRIPRDVVAELVGEIV